MRRHLWLVVAGAALMGAALIDVGAAPVIARQDPRASAAAAGRMIAGRVVTADGSKPIRAILEAVPVAGGAVARRVRADADGRFVLVDLGPNEYRLSAILDGYVTLEFGQRQPLEPGRPIDLRTAASFDKADFALPRASAVEGRLVDEFGDPAPGVEVQIARLEYVAGKRRLLPVFPPRGTRPTDDRGEFRIFGLPPGDYYLMALSGPFTSDNNRAGFAPTFYPGTASAPDAQPVRIDVGRDVVGLTFALAPSASASVSGSVMDASGQPARATTVALFQTTSGDIRFIVPARVPAGADGGFTFRNVPFGSYVIQAMSGQSGFGARVVNVDRPEIAGLDITITEGVTLRGRLAFEGASPPPPTNRVRIQAGPIEFVTGPMVGRGFPQPRFGPDGTFEITGMTGLRVVRVDAPAPWGLSQIRWNGADVTDAPIDFRTQPVDGVEIVLTDRLASLTGVLLEADQPTANGSLVLFAEDSSKWTFPSRFIAIARPNQQGQFTFASLPPATYLIAAVPMIQGLEWQDPAVLELLRARASRVTLADGQRQTVTVRLPPR
jgi:hypothetical protein